MTLNEPTVEDAALKWLDALGYSVGHEPSTSRILSILNSIKVIQLPSGELSVSDHCVEGGCR
jgi:hypothetical protein